MTYYKYKIAIVTTGLSLLGIVFGIFSHSVSAQTVTPSIGGVGYTIQETFPDENFAQFIAGKLAGGDVNAVLTQDKVNGVTQIYAPQYGIADITGIEVFSNLESVLLENNNLVSLPDSICSLTKLKTIYIPYNQITSLPENMGDLVNLKQLNLNSNKLTDLPDSLFELGSLQSMYLGNNQIQSVSEDIGKLSGLMSLRLGSNQLTSLPESIGSLSKLQELLLENNQLRSLPESIGNLTLLRRLDLPINQLKSIPDSIGNLSSLEVLFLSRNQLISVPESIGDLSNLKQLYLDYNQLTRIPESIGKLSVLTRLYLGDNQLTSLPESLGDLSSLKHSSTDFTLQNNLLPTNYKIRLNELFGITVKYETQNQLCMKKDAMLIYDIHNYSDYDNIIQESFLTTLVDIDRNGLRIPLSLEHELIIENYVDEDGNQVDISEYIQNGIIIKEGSVFIQVRASGAGVFPNNSDHALTADKIQFNFKKSKSSYNLKFDLNGGTDTMPTTQILFEGERGNAPAEPKREGFVFKSWNTLKDGSGTTWNFTTNKMPASDVILYAQWEGDGKSIDPITIIKLPKTGDVSNVIGSSILLAGIGTLLMVINRKRKTQK